MKQSFPHNYMKVKVKVECVLWV